MSPQSDWRELEVERDLPDDLPDDVDRDDLRERSNLSAYAVPEDQFNRPNEDRDRWLPIGRFTAVSCLMAVGFVLEAIVGGSIATLAALTLAFVWTGIAAASEWTYRRQSSVPAIMEQDSE